MIIGRGKSVLTFYHVSTWAIAEQPHSRCGMVSSVLWHNVHVRSNHRSCCFFTQYAFVRASCCKMLVCSLSTTSGVFFHFEVGLKLCLEMSLSYQRCVT